MRPTLLTEEREAKLLVLLRDGNFKTVACEAAGISVRSLYRWMEVGQADDENEVDSELRRFYLGVRRALAEAGGGGRRDHRAGGAHWRLARGGLAA